MAVSLALGTMFGTWLFEKIIKQIITIQFLIKLFRVLNEITYTLPGSGVKGRIMQK